MTFEQREIGIDRNGLRIVINRLGKRTYHVCALTALGESRWYVPCTSKANALRVALARVGAETADDFRPNTDRRPRLR